tara:strand:+ start:144 stop:938 length:795 start_codon:yes stop_codon:yes gene_type:complete
MDFLYKKDNNIFDIYLLLFLLISSLLYIINAILFQYLKPCKEAFEIRTILFRYDTYIKFLIYCIFIYLISYYKDITESHINKIIFFCVAQVILIISNLFNSSNIFRQEIKLLYNNQQDLIYKFKKNILNIIKYTIIILFILFFILYNFYFALIQEDYYYWIKVIIIIIVIGIYIFIHNIEGTDVHINNCDEGCINKIKQKLNIKMYFIMFLSLFLICKDNNYISPVLFGIIFGLFIDYTSRLGIDANLNLMPLIKKNNNCSINI